MSLISSIPDSEPPIKQAIRDLVNVMRIDHGKLFTAQFDNDKNTVNVWQYRLFSKVNGLDPNDLIAGYELISEQRPGHMPNIHEIVSATITAKKNRVKAEREQAEVSRVAALPKPEDSKTDRQKVFELIRVGLANMGKRENAGEKDERINRLNETYARHVALLGINHGKSSVDNIHSCAVGFCDKAGVLSHGTGGGNFYCVEHYNK